MRIPTPVAGTPATCPSPWASLPTQPVSLPRVPSQAWTSSPTARRNARRWATRTVAGCPPSCPPMAAKLPTTAATCTCQAWTLCQTPRCSRLPKRSQGLRGPSPPSAKRRRCTARWRGRSWTGCSAAPVRLTNRPTWVSIPPKAAWVDPWWGWGSPQQALCVVFCFCFLGKVALRWFSESRTKETVGCRQNSTVGKWVVLLRKTERQTDRGLGDRTLVGRATCSVGCYVGDTGRWACSLLWQF